MTSSWLRSHVRCALCVTRCVVSVCERKLFSFDGTIDGTRNERAVDVPLPFRAARCRRKRVQGRTRLVGVGAFPCSSAPCVRLRRRRHVAGAGRRPGTLDPTRWPVWRATPAVAADATVVRDGRRRDVGPSRMEGRRRATPPTGADSPAWRAGRWALLFMLLSPVATRHPPPSPSRGLQTTPSKPNFWHKKGRAPKSEFQLSAGTLPNFAGDNPF